jgi:hypothetical protein
MSIKFSEINEPQTVKCYANSALSVSASHFYDSQCSVCAVKRCDTPAMFIDVCLNQGWVSMCSACFEKYNNDCIADWIKRQNEKNE